MIVSQSDFARIAGVSRQAVSKHVAMGTLVLNGKGVDLEHPDTVLYLEKRGITQLPEEVFEKYQDKKPAKESKPRPVKRKAPPRSKPGAKKSAQGTGSSSMSDPGVETRRELEMKKLKLEIQEKEVKVSNQIFLQKKQRSEVVEWNIADFLFFGYLEKINLDLLRMPKKIEPIVENLAKEGKTREIIRRFEREITTIIREIKKNQASTVKKWEEENGNR